MTARINIAFFGFISLLLIALQYTISFESLPAILTLLLGSLLLLSGLPHGALDIWISRETAYWYDVKSFVLFHALYIGVAIISFALFLSFPVISLSVFLMASVFHFSDDWGDTTPLALRLLLAAQVILIPTIFHSEEVAAIFALLTGMRPDTGGEAFAAMGNNLAMIFVGINGILWLLYRQVAIVSLIVVIAAISLPPLIFFGCYFACWHSIRHMREHASALEGSMRQIALFGYSVAAIIVMLCTAHFLIPEGMKSLLLSENVVKFSFWGLAALTVPHMILLALAARRPAT